MLKPRPEQQTADAVLMVRPNGFAFNEETAATNAFMQRSVGDDLNRRVMQEFDGLVLHLQDAGVEVALLENQHGPDALFPNNWLSTHADGTAVLYPMAAPSRREERAPAEARTLLAAAGFNCAKLVDLTAEEEQGRFLEGTGSVVLDRVGRLAFACRGPRTHSDVLSAWAERLDYQPILFDAIGPDGRPVYHTNVLLSLGSKFAMICLAPVPAEQRGALVGALEAGGRTVIEADWQQLTHFACNILELRSRSGEPLVALSSAALRSLRPEQRSILQRLGGALVDAPVPTIEAVGGGGVRCMLAEVHLPRRA